MILKYWKLTDKERLLEDQHTYQFPTKVTEQARNVLDCLNKYYEQDRGIEEDGGYVAILTGDHDTVKREYQELLDQHHVKREEAEFEDDICKEGEGVWQSDLYIVSNDYGVTIIYPKKGEEAWS